MRFCFRASLALGVVVTAAAAQAPPRAQEIQARLIAAFQQDQQALERFTHREHVVSVKEGVRDARTLKVWYVNGRAVSETIALDDRPLSAAELEAEHRRALVRDHAASQRQPPPTGVIEFAGRTYPFSRLADDYIYSDAVTRQWQGRTVWVYQARPNPAQASRSREETLLLHSAGEVWVDAEDMHVVRVAIHSTAPVRYGLGILATIHQAELELQLERRQPGLWLPEEADFAMQATVLEFDHLRRGKRQSFSDFEPAGNPRHPPR